MRSIYCKGNCYSADDNQLKLLKENGWTLEKQEEKLVPEPALEPKAAKARSNKLVDKK